MLSVPRSLRSLVINIKWETGGCRGCVISQESFHVCEVLKLYPIKSWAFVTRAHCWTFLKLIKNSLVGSSTGIGRENLAL